MLQAGMLFERYEILSRLGSGGMGEVYQARDTQLGRTVALKVLKPGLDSKRLLREAQATAALQHPNAVAIFDVGEEDGRPFLVMELLQGKTLGAHIGDRSVGLPQKLAWLAEVGGALAAAHDKGIVHRDIKPDNIFITAEGTAKVLDFGLARAFPGGVSGGLGDQMIGTLTASHPQAMSPGTPLYMAPEQVRGDPVDGRTDQFALALVAYELLGGGLPWSPHGPLVGLLAQVLTAPCPPLTERAPGLPPALDAAIQRALSKEPSGRFERMEDFIDALTRPGLEGTSLAPTHLAQTQLPPTEQAPARLSHPPTSTSRATPLTDASAFLGAFARALRAARMPDDPDDGEQEAYLAHRLFDVADSERLHCAAKECKRSGRVGPLAGRPGIARHELKKALFSYSFFRQWGDYSLPVCIIEHVSGVSGADFLGEMWGLLAAFAPLRVALVRANAEADADALIEGLREEAVASSWQYPPGTDDLLLVGVGAPVLDWRVVLRPSGADAWSDAGTVLSRASRGAGRGSPSSGALPRRHGV